MLAGLGVGSDEAAMVGDDLESDIGGALRASLAGILVRTGRYREPAVVVSAIERSATVDSIADVPRLLLSSSPRSECVDGPDGGAGARP